MAGIGAKDRDPLAGTELSDTRGAGSSAGVDRMADGVGQAASHMVDATRQGLFPGDNSGGERSQGEVAGAGSMYAAQLNERPNLSNPRNQGPSRAPSRLGAATLPVVGMGSRNTGRKA